MAKKHGQIIRVTIRFTLVQKNEPVIMNHLKTLLSGSSSSNKDGDIIRLYIAAIPKVKQIFDYLDKYPLKSNKNIALVRAKKIYYRITDGKFKLRLESKRSRERLINLVRNINKNN